MHLAIDFETQEILAALTTDSATGDPTAFSAVFAQINRRLKQVKADVAYWTHKALFIPAHCSISVLSSSQSKVEAQTFRASSLLRFFSTISVKSQFDSSFDTSFAYWKKNQFLQGGSPDCFLGQ